MQPSTHDPGSNDAVPDEASAADEHLAPASQALALSPAVPVDNDGRALAAQATSGEASDLAHSRPRTTLEADEPVASGRHWFVAEDQRLLGVEVTWRTGADGVAEGASLPFAVDGPDLFYYESYNDHRLALECHAPSTSSALRQAVAFLHTRYPSLRPATQAEVPVTPHTPHAERLVIRFEEWMAAVAEPTDATEH